MNESVAGAENPNSQEGDGVLLAAYAEMLRQRNEEQEKSYFDKLTRLKTRGAFVYEVQSYLDLIDRDEFVTIRETGKTPKVNAVSVIMFDIDKFKSVNDTYGHDVGDIVLRKVAEVILQYSRGYDPAGRMGGEEMALAMIGVDEEQAEHKANFIREKIEQLDFSEDDPRLKDFKVTVSAGVATSRKFPEYDSLMRAADEALYNSKNTGRNKVTAYSDIKQEVGVDNK